MIRTGTRPQTEEESEIFATLVTGARTGGPGVVDSLLFAFVVMGTGFLFGVFTLGLALAWALDVEPGSELARRVFFLPAFATSLVAGAVFLVRPALEARHSASIDRAAYQADLDSGEVETLSCTALDVWRIDEFEDEGMTYMIQLPEGQVLHLQGQYLDELTFGEEFWERDADEPRPEKYGSFPTRSFDVVRGVVSRRLVRLIPTGDKIAPSIVLQPDRVQLPDLANGEIVPGTLADFARQRLGLVA